MKHTGLPIKQSRRLGIALTPKAVKYLERRPYPPGQHGGTNRRFGKMSDYKRQLLEKQRLRTQYNVHERQLNTYARKAMSKAGNPVDNFIQLLETRLDAVVHRAGLARTIYAARQYVSHGHIQLNGRRVNIPSAAVKPGDQVSVKPQSREIPCFVELAEEIPAHRIPDYLERSREEMAVRLLYLPPRDEVPVQAAVSQVIEFYSR